MFNWRTFDDNDPDIFQKGIFPYEHMTDRDVFKVYHQKKLSIASWNWKV